MLPEFEFYSMFKGKKIRKEIENVEKRMSIALDSIPDLIYWKNKDLEIIGANHAFAKKMGFTKERVIGRLDNSMRWSADTLKKLKEKEMSVLEKKERDIQDIEKFSFNDGTSGYYDISRTPLFNTEKEVAGIFIRMHDISKRKKVEDELKNLSAHLDLKVKERTKELEESRIRFKKLFDASPDLIFTDIEGKILDTNPSCETFFQTEGYQLDGQIFDIFNSQKLHKYYSLLRSKRDVINDSFEAKFTGQTRDFFYSLIMRLIELKKEECVQIHAQDITEQANAIQKYSELIELKSNFIREASHDLKAPITAAPLSVEL